MRRTTRDDVARLAGVSVAVVSYVLGGSAKSVAPETRERVLRAVEQLGYRPNAVARALSRGTADLIGLVVHNQSNPYFAELVLEIDRAAHGHGKTLIVSGSHSRRSTEADLRTLTAFPLDGVIIADHLQPAEAETLDRSGLPVVLVNQFEPVRGWPSLGSDYVGGARAATEHLVSLGHRRIAFVGTGTGLDPRRRGWEMALADAGLRPGPALVADYTLADGSRAGRTLAREHSDVTAVFGSSDQIAMGILHGLHVEGVRVPDDVSVVGFDGTAESAFTVPALTTVSQPLSAIAERAVSAVLGGALDGDERFETDLIVRASTAPPRSTPDDLRKEPAK